MKTEPTEALKSLSNLMMEDEPSFISDETAYNLIHKAFAEGQSNPKIKQLEWDVYDNEWEAESPIGTYVIEQIDTRFRTYFISGVLVHRDCLEEAKKAAQENFNNAVKECLI